MNNILQNFLFGICIMLSSATFAASSPKEIIKKGTRIVYDVNYQGTNYEFTITVTDDSKNYSFDWQMSAPSNQKGTLKINQEDLESATGIFNYFTNGNINVENQCCIVLSRKMYDAFKSNGSMEIITDKKNSKSSVFGNSYEHTQNFGYRNDFSNEFNCKTVNDGNDNEITFVNDPNFPLIIEMKLDWTLKLKNIYN